MRLFKEIILQETRKKPGYLTELFMEVSGGAQVQEAARVQACQGDHGGRWSAVDP